MREKYLGLEGTMAVFLMKGSGEGTRKFRNGLA